MNTKVIISVLICFLSSIGVTVRAQLPASSIQVTGNVRLADVRMRDVCILADKDTKTYYAVSSAGRSVRAFTSKDLLTWEGPHTIFQTPTDFWGDVKIRDIWAPELLAYKGKYYLFATFNTDSLLSEQWRNWLPRVRRGTQVLVGDSPLGPFKPFQNHSTLPVDMMTLDGTLWVEDGVPYMVFCHEWVQIKDGTVEIVRLKQDLSEVAGEPVRLFDGSDAPWAKKSEQWSCYVTDGPYLHRSKSGKLMMIWSGFGKGGYTVGVAVSASGKLRGPWLQQPEPLFADNGGHGMIFKRFDDQLMLVLHQPNKTTERARLFELEDTGETLRIKAKFPVVLELRRKRWRIPAQVYSNPWLEISERFQRRPYLASLYISVPASRSAPEIPFSECAG